MSSPEEFESRAAEMQSRYREEIAQLSSEYLEAFASYPVEYSFTYEGKVHRVIYRTLRSEWEEMIVDPDEIQHWSSEGFGFYPDLDIYYTVDDGVLREGRRGKKEALYSAWRQDFLKKVVGSIPKSEGEL